MTEYGYNAIKACRAIWMMIGVGSEFHVEPKTTYEIPDSNITLVYEHRYHIKAFITKGDSQLVVFEAKKKTPYNRMDYEIIRFIDGKWTKKLFTEFRWPHRKLRAEQIAQQRKETVAV